MHLLSNEGDVDLKVVVVQIVPLGAPRRIDEPPPPVCVFSTQRIGMLDGLSKPSSRPTRADLRLEKAAGEALTVKQAPHRPGTAPALGLRAGQRRRRHSYSRPQLQRRFPMWFRSWLDALRIRTQPRPSRRADASPIAVAQTRRLLVEGLEDRQLLTFLPAVDYPVGTIPGRGHGRLQQRRPISIWPRPTPATIPSACCWATATARSRRRASFATATSYRFLAVGDFNGDGNSTWRRHRYGTDA